MPSLRKLFKRSKGDSSREVQSESTEYSGYTYPKILQSGYGAQYPNQHNVQAYAGQTPHSTAHQGYGGQYTSNVHVGYGGRYNANVLHGQSAIIPNSNHEGHGQYSAQAANHQFGYGQQYSNQATASRGYQQQYPTQPNFHQNGHAQQYFPPQHPALQPLFQNIPPIHPTYNPEKHQSPIHEHNTFQQTFTLPQRIPEPEHSRQKEVPNYCSSCANIPVSLFTEINDEVYMVKPNFSALKSSAITCSFCGLLLTYIEPKITPENASHRIWLYQKKAEQRVMMGANKHLVRYRAGHAFDVAYVISEPDETTDIFRYFPKDPNSGSRVLSGSNVLRACFPSDDAVTISTKNDQSFEFGKQLLQECQRDHKVCRQRQDSSPLPSRLVDVGGNDNEMRIVNTEGIPPYDMPYLCLSYCWGRKLSANLVLTKTSNVAARNVKLEADDLSKTLRDAIVVTRGLGYRYIWIDALCICQDSTEDWHTVSSKMGDIYTNAHLTIAASAAADSTEGMFLSRGFLHTQRCTLTSGDVQMIVSPAENSPAPENEPLHKRAWCFQETFLSPRVLFYTKGELLFQCERMKVTESDWEFGKYVARAEPGEIERWRYRRLNGQIEGVEQIYYDEWRPLVEQYSKRLLTKEGDRLPAISAIARNWIMSRVRQEVEDVYLGGLFRGDLQNSLVWMKHDEEELPMRRPETYVAPSWSWASVTGGVRFCESLNLLVMDILEAGTTSVNPDDSFGQLSGGYLRLSGYVRSATIGTIAEDVPQSSFLIRLPQPTFTEKDMMVATINLPQRYGLYADGLTGQMYFDDEPYSEVCCLFIRSRTVKQGGNPTRSDTAINPTFHGAFFLALVRVGEVYKRVGLGVMFDPDWFEGLGREILTIV